MTPRFKITVENMRKALGREPRPDDMRQVQTELKQAMVLSSEAIVRRHDAFVAKHTSS